MGTLIPREVESRFGALRLRLLEVQGVYRRTVSITINIGYTVTGLVQPCALPTPRCSEPRNRQR